MKDNPYQRLAMRLDALPNGFPPTEAGVELRLLAKLFAPEEADLAAHLRLTLETPVQIAERVGGDPKLLRKGLKAMARRGLIKAGRTEGGLGYGLLPFVVGIYEMQVNTIDAELAELFEQYYQQAFGRTAAVQPPVHRVIPVRESVQVNLEVHPFESVSDILASAKAWGVMDCICRKQKALIGEPCDHPLDVCMIFSQTPGAFDHTPGVQPLSYKGALDTLQRAAEAGLVHTVSNTQQDIGYICNCCTCSCGILRGMAELGLANVVARSAFVNQVNKDLCIGCGACVERCQFGALTLREGVAQVDALRCVGCGVCVPTCPEDALQMVRRKEKTSPTPPLTEAEWMEERAAARDLDLNSVL